MASTRAVESPHYFDRFYSGLYTNRNPLYTPKRIVGISVIPQVDVLVDGLNMELTPEQTIARRPGYPTFCTAAFGSSEWPLALYSCWLKGDNLFNIVDTQTAVYYFTGSALNLIYTKTTTGRSYFQQIGDYLYWCDGTVALKWDGVTVTGSGYEWTGLTNNGIATPPNAPQCPNLNFHDISGHNQYPHAWSPNYVYNGPSSGVSTFWFEDQNGNIQFGFVNQNGQSISANNAPKWSTNVNSSDVAVFGQQTVDGSMNWYCAGPIGTWQPSTGSSVYSYGVLNAVALPILQVGPNNPTYPYNRTDASGTLAWTGDALSGNLRSAAAHSNTKVTNVIGFQGMGFAAPAGAVIKGIQVNLGRVGYYENSSTDACTDYTIQLYKAGTLVGSNYAKTTGGWPSYHALPGGAVQTYGGQTDLWGTTWGPSDINNSGFGLGVAVQCASGSDSDCQAHLISVQIIVFYTVSSISGTYFSSVILDSNGNLQRVKVLGTTGSSAPSWNTQIGGTTTDNSMTWECLGTGNTLAALIGWNYGYSFHTTSGHTSTLSPQLTLVAPIIGTGVGLTGYGSSDTQCDKVDLYRNPDGASLLLYDASTVNVNASTAWTIFDTAQDTDLDELLIGPIADANDPPPTGGTIMAYHMGRMWMVVGDSLYFSAGPDCTNGDPNQAWPPANVFEFQENITALLPTERGLLVFTRSRLWIILGGPQTLTFYPKPLMTSFGAANQNCVVRDEATVYVYTVNRQLKSFTFQDREDVGVAIVDQLAANFAPDSACLTVHRSGQDTGLFISDGSANVYRMDLNNGAWSPVAQPVTGIGVLNSLETSEGVYTLCIGTVTGAGYIQGRSLSTFYDGANTGTYTGYVTFGSIVLASPGQQPRSLSNFVLEYRKIGTDMSVYVLPNEVSGSFTQIPYTINDPSQLPASTSISMRRYDWMGVQSALPNWVMHFQLKIAIVAENYKNELLGLAIN